MTEFLATLRVDLVQRALHITHPHITHAQMANM